MARSRSTGRGKSRRGEISGKYLSEGADEEGEVDEAAAKDVLVVAKVEADAADTDAGPSAEW